ncbi:MULTISPECIES: GNAT family N-acetyltransferase [Clostridium]|uniref:GNAT family N-acetyltransferase n=1 Tax=Clostridium frigoriphilum TaxID=443253 RepID=A0ABU7USP3_9CLOT|nr:GNAT family N-acetyltransferase [Clostridium sp. DSM 17811]MBU3101299.1 GNAT family N-acetyltransferase [Clostridium sp. DSM 17811]
MIRQIERDEIKVCVEVIRKSFETIAQQFNLTKENCPGNASFMKAEKLYKQYDEGRLMFAYLDNGIIVGYFSLIKNDAGNFELNNLAVLVEYRHKGYGREMIIFAIDKVREIGSNKITIGLIEENTKLRNWYSSLGFIHTGKRKYKHLPFTVGFMKWVQ